MNEELKTDSPTITPVGSEGDYIAPVSSEQRRLWYLAQKSPGDTSYVMAYRLTLKGPLAPDTVEAALRDVVARHEILRSRVVAQEGIPALFVTQAIKLRLVRRDLDGLPPEARDDEAERQARDLASTPFSLTAGPLFRFRLLCLGPERHHLLIVMHHIIGDGWSHSVLIRDFCAFYRQHSERLTQNGLPPLLLQFSDYALWQREFERSGACARQVNHWARAIGPTPQDIRLPRDGTGLGPAPARQLRKRISGALFNRLKVRCREDKCLLSSVYLAAYQATLAFFADQHLFVTGVVTANRTTAETADLVGFFANTLILPAMLDPGEQFAALLRRVDAQMVEVQDNQKAPFDRVVERIGLPRNWEDIAPISALFVLQNAPVGDFSLPGIKVGVERLAVVPAKFPLTLFVIEEGECLTFELDYAPEAFSDEAMANFGAVLKAYAAAYAAGRPIRIGRPDLPAECSPSRIEGPRREAWTSAAVPDLIAAQARARPEATALEDGFGRLSYRELMAEADRYSTKLAQTLGVTPGPIAIALPRSAQLLVAVLAVMRLGRGWVPVDPQAPEAYRADNARGLGIAATIGSTAPDCVACLAPPEIAPGMAASSPSPDDPPTPLRADQLAYIVTTSGSTGRPKHVHVEHGGLANVCRWIAKALELTPEDKGIWKTHIEFDAVNREIFPILIAGGTLVVGPPEAQNDMACLADRIAAAGITHLHCVPSQLAALQSGPGLPASLRAVMCGGEALPGPLAAALRDQFPDLRIFNVYGPTETTVDVTAFEVGILAAGPVPIGSPLPNVTVEIRRQGRPVPIGAAGELWVAGPQVARGITSAEGCFTPFGPSGLRWFDTGDRAVLGGDMALRFLGRADRQFKRNGVRIEPATLERVLEGHPGVASAQVIPVATPDGTGQLAAFICPRSDRPVSDGPAPPEPPQVWKPVFEASYEGLNCSLPPVQNTHGWIDSASRDPIPPRDVLAVIDLAAKRILRWKPGSILELGCGIGTLGFRLAAGGARYLGVDFADAAIDFARAHARAEGIAEAQFEIGDLESFTPPPDIRFDAVVLNSVVQYLPDQIAMTRLLKRAMNYLNDDGFVFLGDLRDARLDEAKNLWRLLYASPAGVSADELALAARIDAIRDDELTIDPSRLASLAKQLGCAPPLVELKTCPGQNELVRFRYDATLCRKGAGNEDKDAVATILAQREARNLLVVPYLGLDRAKPDGAPAGPGPGGTPQRDLTPFELAAEVVERHPDARVLCSPGDQPDRMVCRAVPKDLSCAELCRLLPAPQAAVLVNPALPWHRRQAQTVGLDAYLDACLPAYLRPDSLIALPEMPQLANGKRALGVLRLLAEAAQRAPQGPLPETGTVEAAVATVFERLLGRRIGADDTFFAAGGNSLLATQACSQIARLLGRQVPLKLFFDYASPRRLARALQACPSSASGSGIARRTDLAEAVPSFAQRRLWFIEKLGTGQTVYSIAHASRLSGALDLVVLGRALADLTARHAPLRAAFPEVDGQPLVRIAPPESLAPIESLPPGLSLEAAIAAIQAARTQPFDLAEGPLLRVLHAALGPDEHLLAVLAHHIILDGWSMAIVLRDLECFYRRRLDPGILAPAPLAVDYFDLAAHQVERAATGGYDVQIAYWTDQLAGAPPRLALPCDFPEMGRRSWEGGEIEFRIPKALVHRVTQLCAETGATEFMVLLAVFKILLFRVSGTEDLVVGTVIANRHLPETEELAGFLVNPLALRSRIDPDWSFRQMLGRLKETCLAAFENQDVPFEMLLEHLEIDRRSDYQAVFQVMFAMQNAPRATLALPGLASERVRLSGNGAMFDLGLEIRADGDERIGLLEYAADRFERRTAERMAARFVRLLNALLQDAGRTLGTVPMIDATEVAEILRFSRGPALEEALGDALPWRVAQIARVDPDRPALTMGETRYSYGTLQGAVEHLAGRLGQAGVAEGDRVGLLLPRTPAVAAAFLAVQACRALPVYLNPALPRARLLHLVSQARLGWTLRDAAAPALESPGDIPLPEDLFVLAAAYSTAPADLSAAPAYATFTSGSSGHPKAVLISQGAIAARLRANDRLFGPIGEGDRFAHVYSFDYDGGLVSLFWPLTRGAETVFLPLSALGNMADLTEQLAAGRITVFDSIPAVLTQLYETWPGTGLPDLRLVVTGGDTCPADLAARHFARTDAVFANQYGPCEGVVNASSVVVRTEREAGRRLTVGTPIPGADIFILDPSGGLSGIGMRGEMAIGGDWIADGYVDAPELTAARFVTRDLEGLGRRRIYLSGDLGRWCNSGEIEFLGRADRQVQIDGMRVDLTEIETVLAAETEVQDVRVLIAERDDAKRLAAFVVPAIAATDENCSLQNRWAEAFDRLYRTGASSHPAHMRDFCGWSDTATGDPLPPAQMDAWLDETLAVLRSAGASKVLELGAGLGLITRAMAGTVVRYVATDISTEACAHLQAAGQALALSALEVRRIAAEDVPAVYADARFDLIVLNSLVQYLPSAGRLRSLLTALLQLLTPNGMLFVGDVRDLRLRQRFYRHVHARRVTAGLATPSPEVEIPRQEIQDEELHVDPGLFIEVARAAGPDVVATVLHKSGGGPQELVDYRFDAILRHRAGPRIEPAVLDGAGVPSGAIEDVLKTHRGPLCATGLSRLGGSAEVRGWLSAAQSQNRSFALLAEADPERCTVFVLEGAHFLPAALPPAPELTDIPKAPLANLPTFTDTTRGLQRKLRASLAAKLPAHMIPSQFHFLPGFPMREGAKVDEKALLAQALDHEPSKSCSWRDDLALAMMRDIWAEIIGAAVPADDSDFFALGGHSLLAARLAARIEREFRVSFPIIKVFELRRLDAIADFASRTSCTEEIAEARHLYPPQSAPPPSAHQKAILSMLANVPPEQQHIGLSLDLAYGLKSAKLQQVLDEVSQIHPILRRRYSDVTCSSENETSLKIDILSGKNDISGWLKTGIDPLSDGPLALALVEGAEYNSSSLALKAHPFAFDGASVQILLRDLARTYLAADRLDPTAAGLLAPCDYASLVALDKADRVQGDERYAPAPIPWIGCFDTVTNVLAFSKMQSIDILATRLGVTPASVYLAAYARTLMAKGFLEDAQIACTLSSRILLEPSLSERLIGPLAYDLPIDLSGLLDLDPEDGCQVVAEIMASLFAREGVVRNVTRAKAGFSYRHERHAQGGGTWLSEGRVSLASSPQFTPIRLSLLRRSNCLEARLSYPRSMLMADSAVSLLHDILLMPIEGS